LLLPLLLLLLLPAATNSAAACASFVIFLGSLPSLHHAMAMAHPAKPGTPLVDYVFLSLVIPPLLVGIKFGGYSVAVTDMWQVHLNCGNCQQ
jgi:hypothetical protein